MYYLFQIGLLPFYLLFVLLSLACVFTLLSVSHHLLHFLKVLSIFIFYLIAIKLLQQTSFDIFKRAAKIFSWISFITNDIGAIDWDLHPNRAHGRDMISIRMLKFCEESILKPFQILHRKSPISWWMENVVPAH